MFDTIMIAKVCGNLGACLLFVAFLFSSVLVIRTLTLVSTALLLFYFYVIAGDPLWINIFWKCMLFLSTTWGLFRYFYSHRHIHFSPIEDAIRKRNFSFFSDVEFKTLLNLGVLRTFPDGERLIQNQQGVKRLFLLVEGTVRITDINRSDVILEPGQYIGEMSFLTGNRANGTAIVSSGCTCLYWMQSDLTALKLHEPELAKKLDDCFSVDVVKKLSASPG